MKIMKKKKTKLFILLSIVSIILVIVLVFSLCRFFSPYSYSYPKEYTGSYCVEQYELFDPNIRYTECYEFVEKKHWFWGWPYHNFSAIRGEDSLSFMVVYSSYVFLGSNNAKIRVVRNVDCAINPITDFTPSKVELFWYRGDPDWDYFDSKIEKYYNFAANFMWDTEGVIDSPKAIDEIMNVATRDTVLCYHSLENEQKEQSKAIGNKKLNWIHKYGHGELYVKVSFEECSGLVLIGQIKVDEDGYSYMEHNVYYDRDARYAEATYVEVPTKLSKRVNDDGDTYEFFYRLGENMDSYIRPIVDALNTANTTADTSSS